MTDTGRTRLKPGASVGTRIMLARLWGAASGSVTTIAIATAAPTAPLVNHLWASITHSSPSSSARPRRPVGSEPAVSGSVMLKQLRMSPSRSPFSQRSFCSSVPCSRMISALPVSGAEQLKTMGLTMLRPISSQSIPYSQLVSPPPWSSPGRNRFQRPSAFARLRRSTRMPGYGTPGPTSSSSACSASSSTGYTCSSRKAAMRALSSSTLGEGEKSMPGRLPHERQGPLLRQLVEGILHLAGHLFVDLLRIRLRPEALLEVDGRHHLDRDLRRQRQAARQVEHREPERRRDLHRQHLDARELREARQPSGRLAAGHEEGRLLAADRDDRDDRHALLQRELDESLAAAELDPV